MPLAIQNLYPSVIKNVRLKVLLLTYIFNEYSQELHYYPFAVKLNRCVGSFNTLNDLSNKVYVPNKTEDLHLSVVNMITGIKDSKTLTKHISCEYANVNVNLMVEIVIQKWNNDKY